MATKFLRDSEESTVAENPTVGMIWGLSLQNLFSNFFRSFSVAETLLTSPANRLQPIWCESANLVVEGKTL